MHQDLSKFIKFIYRTKHYYLLNSNLFLFINKALQERYTYCFDCFRGPKGSKGFKGDKGYEGPQGLFPLALKNLFGDKGEIGPNGEKGDSNLKGRPHYLKLII